MRDPLEEAQDGLRICLFLPSLGGGGAERVFARLAMQLVRRGHSVAIVLMTSAQMEYREEMSSAVRIVDLKRPRLWTSLPTFRRYLLREKPDVVISAMPLANGVAAWAVRLSRRASILLLTEHNAVSMAFGDLAVRRYRPLMWAIRPSYRFADALVGVSEEIGRRLCRMRGVDRGKVNVIYNPAWHPSIEAQAAEAVSHPWLNDGGVPVVIAVGRLEKEKDFHSLLVAFALLRRRRPARLMVLGEGSQRKALERLAAELEITNDFSMPGFVANPFALMARADVFVLSSVHEGLPTVLVEAMACGTAVVSTDCPSGPSEILDGGLYGPLVPVGDCGAMATAIGQQIDDPMPAERLRARAREFATETSTDAYLTLIASLQVMRRRRRWTL